MKPYLFLPFVKEALERAFEEDPFVSVHSTSSYLVARAGGHRFKILVRIAPEGSFLGPLLVHLLKQGYSVFVVHPQRLEGALITHTKALPFSTTPEVLDWPTISLSAVSRVFLPAYAFEGVEL